MTAPRAIDYAALVGRYIRMERDATAEEREQGHPYTIGQECTVGMVSDLFYDGTRVGVMIVSDDGLEFLVDERFAEAWAFTVWPDEGSRKIWETM